MIAHDQHWSAHSRAAIHWRKPRFCKLRSHFYCGFPIGVPPMYCVTTCPTAIWRPGDHFWRILEIMFVHNMIMACCPSDDHRNQVRTFSGTLLFLSAHLTLKIYLPSASLIMFLCTPCRHCAFIPHLFSFQSLLNSSKGPKCRCLLEKAGHTMN